MQTDMMSKVLNMIYESFKRSLMRFNAVDIVTIENDPRQRDQR